MFSYALLSTFFRFLASWQTFHEITCQSLSVLDATQAVPEENPFSNPSNTYRKISRASYPLPGNQ
jgi:hypothetical protein